MRPAQAARQLALTTSTAENEAMGSPPDAEAGHEIHHGIAGGLQTELACGAGQCAAHQATSKQASRPGLRTSSLAFTLGMP